MTEAKLPNQKVEGSPYQKIPKTQEDCEAAGGTWDDATQTCIIN